MKGRLLQIVAPLALVAGIIGMLASWPGTLEYLGPAEHPADLADFEETEELLREWCDPGYPVEIVRSTEYPDHWGFTEWDDDEGAYRITIHPASPASEVETLIHEWAHVLVFEVTTGHGPRWGRAYARCYYTVYGD